MELHKEIEKIRFYYPNEKIEIKEDCIILIMQIGSYYEIIVNPHLENEKERYRYQDFITLEKALSEFKVTLEPTKYKVSYWHSMIKNNNCYSVNNEGFAEEHVFNGSTNKLEVLDKFEINWKCK